MNWEEFDDEQTISCFSTSEGGYLYAIVDRDNHLLAGFTPDGWEIPPDVKAENVKIQSGSIADTELYGIETGGYGDLLTLTDQEGRVILRLDKSGSISLSGLNLSTAESGEYAGVVTDADGKILAGIKGREAGATLGYSEMYFCDTPYGLAVVDEENHLLGTFPDLINPTIREPEVVTRNKDAENYVFAACHYGFHRNGVHNHKKDFAMLVSTDIHGDSANLVSAVEYLNAMPAIDCGCCLGDLQTRHYSDNDGTWYTGTVKKSVKPFYTVIGNHDAGNTTEASECGTVEEVCAKFITPTARKIGSGYFGKSYYRVDWDKYGISLIVLDVNDDPCMKGTDGNYLITRGTECLSQEQINWLVNELMTIPAKNHLVMMAHNHAGGSHRLEHTFSQKIDMGGACGVYQPEFIPEDIIQAWILGGSINKTYAPHSDYAGKAPNITVNADFSTRGKGNFVCWLCGHVHIDNIDISAKYANQKIVRLCSSSADTWQNGGLDLPRERGTKSADALTVFAVDTANRKIKLVRIGSTVTEDFNERRCGILEY